jgi:hypothetical protein
MENGNKKYTILVALTLAILVLTLPFTSALSLKGIVSGVKNVVSKVVTAVKNVVNKVVSVFTGKSSGGGSTNNGGSGGGSGGNDVGGNDGGTYYPEGDGVLISSPEVIYSAPITVDVLAGDSLYHDVDLTAIELTCINCPTSNPKISGFDYNLKVSFANKGNTIAKDVEMTILMEFPDGEKRSFSFTKGNSMNIAPGNYQANFIIPNVGVNNQNNLKPYALRSGSNLIYEIKTTITLSNDRGVDRAKIRYEYTPVRECKWTGTTSNPIYSCKDLEPTKATLFYCSDGTLIRKDTSNNPVEPTITELKNTCTIADTKEENQIKENLFINTVSPELWGGGGLNSILK